MTPKNAGRLSNRGEVARELLVGLPLPVLVVFATALGQSPIALAGAVAMLMLAVVSPSSGLIGLAFLAATKPILVLPAPGFMVFLAFAIAAGYLFRLPIDRPRLSVGKIALLVMSIALYTFVQQSPEMIAGYSDSEAYAVGFKFFQFAAATMAAMGAALVLQSRRPYATLAALIAGGLFVAGLAFLSFDDPEPVAMLANLIPEPDEGARATGSFGNPNYFGFFIATATVLAIAMLRFATTRGTRLILASAVVVLAASLSLSLSRGAIAALVAGVICLAFLHGRRTGLIAIVATAFIGLVAYPLFVEFRLTMLTGGVDEGVQGVMASSDASRLSAVLSGPALWATSPIFGIGFAKYNFESADIIGSSEGFVAHNWYMTVLAEQGVVGIILWLLLLSAIAVALVRRPNEPRTVGLAMLSTVAVGFMFLHPPTAFQAAALPAIVIAAALVADWSPINTPVSPRSTRVGVASRTERLPVR